MARPKKIHNGVTTSIFIEKDLKEIAKLCKNVTDSDLWVTGLKATLQANGSQESLKRLLQVYQIEKDEVERKIEIISSKLADKQGRIWVRKRGDDTEFTILPSEFDINEHVKLDKDP